MIGSATVPIWTTGMIAIIEKMANVTVTITIKPENPSNKT